MTDIFDRTWTSKGFKACVLQLLPSARLSKYRYPEPTSPFEYFIRDSLTGRCINLTQPSTTPKEAWRSALYSLEFEKAARNGL